MHSRYQYIQFMIHSLKKGSSLLYIQMKTGHTIDLYGVNFEIEYSNDHQLVNIYVDLTENLKKSNDLNYSFSDTIKLEKEINSIEYIQITDQYIIQNLKNHLNRMYLKNCTFVLNLIIKKVHNFNIIFRKSCNDLLLVKQE